MGDGVFWVAVISLAISLNIAQRAWQLRNYGISNILGPLSVAIFIWIGVKWGFGKAFLSFLAIAVLSPLIWTIMGKDLSRRP